MRTFLARRAKDQERSIVLLGEKLEGSGVFERVDGVLLGEFLGEWDFQLVQVGEGVLHYLRAGCAAEEEGGFRVLDRLGGLFIEGALASCIAGFSRELARLKSRVIRESLHLSQHLDVVFVQL